MTFLMFFDSSQAIFTATSFSHTMIFCPAEEEDYKAQVFMQVSSSHLLLRRDAPQSGVRHFPCLELSSGVLDSSEAGSTHSTECHQHTPRFVAGIKWGGGAGGLMPCSALAEAPEDHWRGGNTAT